MFSSNSELTVIDCPLSANYNWVSGSICKCLDHIKCVWLCWVLHYYGMQLALRMFPSFSYKTCSPTKELSCFMSTTTLLHDESCFELLCQLVWIVWFGKHKGQRFTVHMQTRVLVLFKVLTESVSPSTGGSLVGGISTTLSSLSRSVVTVPSWRCGFLFITHAEHGAIASTGLVQAVGPVGIWPYHF